MDFVLRNSPRRKWRARVATGADEVIVNQLPMSAAYLSAILASEFPFPQTGKAFKSMRGHSETIANPNGVMCNNGRYFSAASRRLQRGSGVPQPDLSVLIRHADKPPWVPQVEDDSGLEHTGI